MKFKTNLVAMHFPTPWISPLKQIMCLLDMMQCVTGCCGYGDWLQRYKQSKDEKETERLAERQFREQRSERLINPNLII